MIGDTNILVQYSHTHPYTLVVEEYRSQCQPSACCIHQQGVAYRQVLLLLLRGCCYYYYAVGLGDFGRVNRAWLVPETASAPTVRRLQPVSVSSLSIYLTACVCNVCMCVCKWIGLFV